MKLLPELPFPVWPLYLVPYLIIGYDVLRKAVLGIVHGQVFDENFLMALATVGAFGTGEYAEAVFVMLFYQVGELFQDVAVNRSRTVHLPVDGHAAGLPPTWSGTATSKRLTRRTWPWARPSW